MADKDDGNEPKFHSPIDENNDKNVKNSNNENLDKNENINLLTKQEENQKSDESSNKISPENMERPENLIKLQIKQQNGILINIDGNLNETIYKLEEKLVEHTDIKVENQRLVYSGMILEKDKTLNFYNIDNKKMIYVLNNNPQSIQSSDIQSSIPQTNNNTVNNFPTNTVNPFSGLQGNSPFLSYQIPYSFNQANTSNNNTISTLNTINNTANNALNTPLGTQNPLTSQNPMTAQSLLNTPNLLNTQSLVNNQNILNTPNPLNPSSSTPLTPQMIPVNNPRNLLQNDTPGITDNQQNIANQQNMSNLLGNRELMTQMLNSPFAQSLLDDPEIMRTLFESNPQLRDLRERNPELLHMLNDPQMLRQSIEMMRNPSLLREMMRSTDRAMINIETIPGGYNALKKMYHTIQEPLWDAVDNNFVNDSNGNPQNIYNLDTEAPPETSAIPNPWARNTNPTPASRSIPLPPTPGAPAVVSTPAPPAASLSNLLSMMSMNNQQPNTIPQGNPTPDVWSQLLNPENARDMAQFREAMQRTNSANSPPPIPTAIEPPERRYQTQIANLAAMGFTDQQAVIRALEASNGNLNGAMDILLQETLP